MTAIKGWNGSAWVEPEYCMETSGTDTWAKYTPGRVLYDWSFNGGDTGGWVTTPDPWPPVETTGAEMIARAFWAPTNGNYGSSTNTVYKSNFWEPEEPSGVTGYKAQCSIRGQAYTNPNGSYAKAILQIGKANWSYEWVQHPFGQGSFGNVVLTTPTYSTSNLGMQDCDINIWGTWDNTYGGTSLDFQYDLFIDWVRVLDQNGNQIFTKSTIPQYWNGSSWVAQNAV